MRIILSGALGKMGKQVKEILLRRGDKIIEIDGLFSGKTANCKCEGKNAEECGNCPEFNKFADFSDITAHADAIIDFSAPALTLKAARYALKTQTPLVIGTTGLNEDCLIKIKEVSEIAPVCVSGNFSPAVCAYIKAAKLLSENLSGYDAVISETHHKEKKDAPSGTAAAIARELKTPVKTVSMRGGTVCGVHETHFFGENDEITLIHRAYSRKIFAEGAVKCARELIKKPAGLYKAEDLLFN